MYRHIYPSTLNGAIKNSAIDLKSPSPGLYTFRPGFAEIGSIKLRLLPSLFSGNQSALEDDWETSPVDGNRQDKTGQIH